MVGDHFRVAIEGALAGQLVVNTFHYRQSTANTSTLTDNNSLAYAVYAKFVDPAARLLAVLSQDVEIKNISSRLFPLPGTPVTGFDFPSTKTGLVLSDALPPSVSAVARRKTAFLGRKYRGRIFVPGIPAAVVADGELDDAGYLTDMGDLAIALYAPLTWTAAGSPTFIPEICTILSDGGTPPTYTYRATDIVSAEIDLILRSQRRREVGRGA